MEARALERLERIARRLPVKKLEFGRTNTLLGEIRFAYGQDAEDIYHGIWAVEDPKPVARYLDFFPGVTEDQVRKSLVANAVWLLTECDKRNLLQGEKTFGKAF